jgi:hypothetical protein
MGDKRTTKVTTAEGPTGVIVTGDDNNIRDINVYFVVPAASGEPVTPPAAPAVAAPAAGGEVGGGSAPARKPKQKPKPKPKTQAPSEPAIDLREREIPTPVAKPGSVNAEVVCDDAAKLAVDMPKNEAAGKFTEGLPGTDPVEVPVRPWANDPYADASGQIVRVFTDSTGATISFTQRKNWFEPDDVEVVFTDKSRNFSTESDAAGYEGEFNNATAVGPSETRDNFQYKQAYATPLEIFGRDGIVRCYNESDGDPTNLRAVVNVDQWHLESVTRQEIRDFADKHPELADFVAKNVKLPVTPIKGEPADLATVLATSSNFQACPAARPNIAVESIIRQ